jgi:hypothetical protein
MSHGVGFQTFTNGNTGATAGFRGLGPLPARQRDQKAWVDMTNAERQASAPSSRPVVSGGRVAAPTLA